MKMKFEDVENRLMNGERIRRSWWSQSYYLCFNAKENIFEYHGYALEDEDVVLIYWCENLNLSPEELEADNWEVAG
jgi:hypothetical protein